MNKRLYSLDVPNPYDELVEKWKKNGSQAIYTNQHHQRYIKRENTLTIYGKRIQQSKPTFEWIRSAQMSISHDQKQIRKHKGHTKNQKSDNERSIEKPTTVHVYSTSQKQCSSTEQLKQLPLENIRGTKLQRITTLVAFSQYLSSTGHDLTLLDDIETMLQETTSGVVVDSWLEPLVDLSSELDEWVTCDFVHHFCFTCPFGCTIGNRRRRCGQR